MAVKKKAGAGAAAKSAPTKAAASKAAPAPAKAAPKAAASTAAKAGTPKAAPKASTAKPAAKKAAPVKITDKQAEFLKQIHTAGEPGYKGDKKGESKSLEALLGKKLIKKGAKDKASGAYHYTVSKAGEKHLATSSNSSSAGA